MLHCWLWCGFRRPGPGHGGLGRVLEPHLRWTESASEWHGQHWLLSMEGWVAEGRVPLLPEGHARFHERLAGHDGHEGFWTKLEIGRHLHASRGLRRLL